MEMGTRFGGDEQGHERLTGSRLVLHKGYLKLEPSGGAEQESPRRKRSGSASFGSTTSQRRKWRFRVRPKVRVLYSTISRLVRRLKDSYARVIMVLAAKARETSLHPIVGGSKKKVRIGNGSGRNLSDVEVKYLDYIRRSVTDGELAYYTMSLRTGGIL